MKTMILLALLAIGTACAQESTTYTDTRRALEDVIEHERQNARMDARLDREAKTSAERLAVVDAAAQGLAMAKVYGPIVAEAVRRYEKAAADLQKAIAGMPKGADVTALTKALASIEDTTRKLKAHTAAN